MMRSHTINVMSGSTVSGTNEDSTQHTVTDVNFSYQASIFMNGNMYMLYNVVERQGILKFYWQRVQIMVRYLVYQKTLATMKVSH